MKRCIAGLNGSIEKTLTDLEATAFDAKRGLEVKTYADKRQYPVTGEQFDMLWHAIDEGKFGAEAKTSLFYTTIKAEKDKFPKE